MFITAKLLMYDFPDRFMEDSEAHKYQFMLIDIYVLQCTP